MRTKQPKGTPTSLNIWSLARLAAGRREFPNQIEAPSVPHIRRCFKAGLVEVVERTTLKLTEAGVAAVNAAAVRDTTIVAVAS